MRTLLLVTITLMVTQASAQTNRITLKTLLEEMTDRTAYTKWPEASFTCKQFSSYSRDSKTIATRDEDARFKPETGRDWGQGWFENHDFGNYIRTEEIHGRKEDVMFEADGPGAIVRFWCTFGGVPSEYGGIYRVYIDGNPNPVIEMHNRNIAGKAGLVGKPFSFYAPEKAENEVWRGGNMYLPIPYNKSCKVTYDGEHKYAHIEGWNGHYYQINYRTYTSPVEVESFNKSTVSDYKDVIAVSGKKLLEDPESGLEKLVKENIVLEPGERLTLRVKGAQAVTLLKMKLKADNSEQMLRSTVLEATFDKNQTIWCPVGQFYGIGYTTKKHRSYYVSTTADGWMTSQWVMPFSKKAEVSVVNYGDQAVTIESVTLGHEMYQWDEQSMYFHAAWKETRGLESELRSDYNFIDIKGKGVFMADNLTLFNSDPDTTGANWWGEGDEKIYVDGEYFPSHFGTGTEDYYGYAWCRPQWFSNPWGSQPIGEGNKTPGITSNNRYRLLDVIPFSSDFRFDMEIWHPYRAKMNYSPATFFYAQKDATCNAKPDIDGVRQQVAVKIEDVVGSE